jgi:hypothetical protein
MNKHIELVKKWLDDPASVTQQELQGNSDAAWATWSTIAYDGTYEEYGAYYTANAASDAANAATYADARTKVKHWIIRYEELKEQEDER